MAGRYFIMADYRYPSRPFSSSGDGFTDLLNLGRSVVGGIRDWGKPEFDLSKHGTGRNFPAGSYERMYYNVIENPRTSPEVKIQQLKVLESRFATPEAKILDSGQRYVSGKGEVLGIAPHAPQVLDSGQRYVSSTGELLNEAPYAPKIVKPGEGIVSGSGEVLYEAPNAPVTPNWVLDPATNTLINRTCLLYTSPSPRDS